MRVETMLNVGLVADQADAEKIGNSHNPSVEFAGLEAPEIDSVKLGALNAILTDTKVDLNFMGDDSFLFMAGDEGPWVQLIPSDVIQRLAALNSGQIPSIATAWLQTEEFGFQKTLDLQGLAEQFLSELGKMASRAVGERKSLLLWTSH